MTWQTTPTVLAAADAAAKPAGGAALDQVVLATGAAAAGLAGLFWLIARHRAGRAPRFERPTALAGIALMTALVGMYWDISLHVDNGRDEGPLANPAHYLILVGLFGVFSAGVLAMAMPRENPGRASVAI